MGVLEKWARFLVEGLNGSDGETLSLTAGRQEVMDLQAMLVELKDAREAKPYLTNLLHMVLNASWEQMQRASAIRQVEWMELIDERRDLIGNVLEMVMEARPFDGHDGEDFSTVPTESIEVLKRIMQGIEPAEMASASGDPVGFANDLRAVFKNHGYDPASPQFSGLIAAMEEIEKRVGRSIDDNEDPKPGLN